MTTAANAQDTNNTNNAAKATMADKLKAMGAIPPIQLEAKHGDLFGQLFFGTAKRALGGECGDVLATAYAERTVMDKTMYYAEGTVDAVKDGAVSAYTTAKEIVVDGYDTVKGWVSGSAKEDAKKKVADDAEAEKNNQANVNRARFEKHFDQIEKTVEYNAKWENGTGYFNHLVTNKDLQTSLNIGEMAKCTDPHGRKMIIMQTSLGLLVVFARHVDEKTSFRVNADKDLIKEIEGFKEECTDSVLSAKGFDIIFGEADNFTLAQKLMQA
jgi:hypothetical protein